MQLVVNFIRTFGGIEYATNKMNELRKTAFDILEDIRSNTANLNNTNNKNEFDQLIHLVNFVIDRNS
jgi:hypothetical protein